MSTALARRDLLAALLAATALPGLAHAATPLLPDLDRAAAARIGKAWLAGRPDIGSAALARRLLPHGRGPDALPALRRQVSEDFRRGAVFVHRGWRLSETEGALFGLLALEE
ncbi:hypothetical protein ASD21_12260 [Caulobacter sp. Root1455]|uniref:hypothetical protein n=1 Tax=Caulobacter sp. Root1455 TaxID=1736465 RepID=UPI0006F7B916|nr:hypothetical protein [Caulobacter sp. Root1455]KQY92197.1 hypothetical protein ASD21_12260 [Caulobacter sp. Root1455]